MTNGRSGIAISARAPSRGEGARAFARRPAHVIAWTLAVAVALAILLAAWWLASGVSRLELRLESHSESGDRLLASFDLAPGQDFTLWFLHSYDRAFFAEHYRLDEDGILLTHMSFKSNLNGEGFEYHDFHLRPDGVGELRNINERRDRVRFMMGSPDMANHTLIIHGQRIPLSQWAQPGQLIYLRAARPPRWRVLLH